MTYLANTAAKFRRPDKTKNSRQVDVLLMFFFS